MTRKEFALRLRLPERSSFKALKKGLIDASSEFDSETFKKLLDGLNEIITEEEKYKSKLEEKFTSLLREIGG